MTRILTYNIHRCLGTDRRLDVGRIADVIAARRPDIVALQEVDVGRSRTKGVDQAHAIAEQLGMAFHFNAALTVEEERYGNAILTTLPERLVKSGPLPGYPPIPGLEPRGALWVMIDAGGAPLNVINTHLGLVPGEPRVQAAALAGPAWIGHPERRGPLIIVGDFNAGGRSQACRALLGGLTDAAKAVATKGRTATFPASMPVRQIDHVFVSPGVSVQAVHAPTDSLARRASDHLPLVVDFTVVTDPRA